MLNRAEVMASRIRAQELDRPRPDPADRPPPVTRAAIWDFGIQDTGRDAASWALVNRGYAVRGPAELAACDQIALAWTLRASPHFYRRQDLPDVMVATSPFSDADAAKRIFGADQPLRAAGIPTRKALSEVARQMRRVVDRPTVKGEVSSRLSQILAQPYLRRCEPCDATHPWEVPFRLGALFGGLELEPGTSPPVLRRIPGWPPRQLGPAADPGSAPPHLQPIRCYLRFLGPATPNAVAAFLDAAVADVKALWPADAVEVNVEGRKSWRLGVDPAECSVPSSLVRLLGPFDLFLQSRDRDLVLPDKTRHKALWPILGRPGAVLSGTDIIGIWRPKAAGKNFSLRVGLWVQASRTRMARIEEQAALLAKHRGLIFQGITAD